MKTLDELGYEHGTDKSSRCHLPILCHGYCDLYESYISCWRNDPINLLEIGVSLYGLGGQSTRMWRDYFPNGMIYCMDRGNMAHLEEDRVRVFQGDAGNESNLRDMIEVFGGDFDIIVDDANHESPQQITSLKTLYPFVKPGGIYVIEDLTIPGIASGLAYENTETTQLLSSWPDPVQIHDDNSGRFRIAFIRKPVVDGTMVKT